MNIEETIIKRRSVKHFDPEHKMTEDEIFKLLTLASLSPTAFNIQNWRYVVVHDESLRKKIRTHAWDQAQVTDASLLIILSADLKAWDKNPERYWNGAPEEVRDIMVPAIDSYYRGKEQTQRDEAMRSCGMTAQSLMLSATSMGYDSCPMDGFDFDKVGKLINLPHDHAIAMFVVVGKGIKAAWPRQGQLNLDEIVVDNSF